MSRALFAVGLGLVMDLVMGACGGEAPMGSDAPATTGPHPEPPDATGDGGRATSTSSTTNAKPDATGDGDSTDGTDTDGWPEPPVVFDLGVIPDAPGPSGQPGACPCERGLDGIYLLSGSSVPRIRFYDPITNTFEVVGDVTCPDRPGSPSSLAVSRAGELWINEVEDRGAGDFVGRLFVSPLSDLSTCDEVYASENGDDVMLGMGFSAEPGTNCDRLYVVDNDAWLWGAGSGAAAFGVFDEEAGAPSFVGEIPLSAAELTGTADGRLFGFGPAANGQGAAIAEIDKRSGALLETIELPDLQVPGAFAFAFWGGDFYMFVHDPIWNYSDVYRYDYDDSDDGGLTLVTEINTIIVGAGVSTCASVAPPQR